jgi:hypothetical protein
MKNKANNPNQSPSLPPDNEMNFSPGYPYYPADEDIYRIDAEDEDIDPENILKIKSFNDDNGSKIDEVFRHTGNGDDLDIPGSELDDELEDIGSEDEENNYYSIGGDDHEDLEESHAE